MKAIGIVVIVIGILMLLFRGFSIQTKKEIVDAGPLEINKKENKWIGWPVYAGGVAIIAGLVILVAERKRSDNSI